MIDIKPTGAFNNSFFRACRNMPERGVLSRLLPEWYAVTQAFCMGMQTYNALFVSEVLHCDEGPRRDALESAMLVSIAIGAGEFGMGRHGLDGIHYRMFARLGEPLGITLGDLRSHPVGTLPNTKRLVEGIRVALSDIYLGAGCVRVVEATAYQIVEAMDSLFRASREPHFGGDHLQYISLHLELEKEHDSLADSFVALLGDTPERTVRIADGIQMLCGLFTDYWESVAQAVFPSYVTD